MSDWRELSRLAGGQEIIVERVRLKESGIAIEGEFEPPQLMGLPPDEQVFLAAFVRSHGSIKQMEKLFGISYPTVKNRLNRIAEKLDFVEIDAAPEEETESVLDRLERGEISVEEALQQLNKGGQNE